MNKPILTRGGYALPGTSSAFKTGDWRVRKPVYQHVHAPCHGTCPAGEDPQAYIAELDAGRPQQAWEKLVSVNPLPAITGRVAAEGIAAVLAGRELPEKPDSPEITVSFDQLNTNYFEPLARHEQDILPPAERIGEIETERTLAPAQVTAEARRCLSCGNCMSCDNCWTLCPDSAVLRLPEGARESSPYRFDYDYCKGCGLCAHECPCGFIAMTEDL